MVATVERFGPKIGTLPYEELKSDFVPMNPPVDEWILDHFVAPMPEHGVNLPEVLVQVEWSKDTTKATILVGHEGMEGYLKRFFSIATLQGVTEDVLRVECYRILHSEGEEITDEYEVIVQPVIRGGIRFENEFERQILSHRVRRCLGLISEHPVGILPTFRSEDFHPTLEDRINSYTVRTELLAIAKLKSPAS